MNNDDKLIIGGKEFSSRFILGSGKYSLSLIESAVRDAGAQIITLAVRRANTKETMSAFLQLRLTGMKYSAASVRNTFRGSAQRE